MQLCCENLTCSCVVQSAVKDTLECNHLRCAAVSLAATNRSRVKCGVTGPSFQRAADGSPFSSSSPTGAAPAVGGPPTASATLQSLSPPPTHAAVSRPCQALLCLPTQLFPPGLSGQEGGDTGCTLEAGGWSLWHLSSPHCRQDDGDCGVARVVEWWQAFLALPAQLLHTQLEEEKEEAPDACWRLEPTDGVALWLTSLWLVAVMETATQLERFCSV
ncbi:uncharacterized protein LOC129044992 [Pongo pygmaeus]|uniref:uncharacterized protein LOC129044992 n=1 Tax=Pongo pygmaeus TaxID=9600 RepID=UPI0023E1BE2A|nr:uncharacterized protein LOC129044992 [Pongo pygmaeus]